MNRTRSSVAILTVVGGLFVSGLAFVPGVAAHTCDTNFVDHLQGQASGCGACPQQNGPHQHDYTVGPVEYQDQQIVGEVTVGEQCSSGSGLNIAARSSTVGSVEADSDELL